MKAENKTMDDASLLPSSLPLSLEPDSDDPAYNSLILGQKVLTLIFQNLEGEYVFCPYDGSQSGEWVVAKGCETPEETALHFLRAYGYCRNSEAA